MPQAQDQGFFKVSNTQVNHVISVDYDFDVEGQVVLTGSKQSTGWTDSDADTGTATFAAGHGFVTGHVLDVRWGASLEYLHYGMAATVTSNSVALDGGSGDDLPVNGTQLTVSRQIAGDVPGTVGANVVALVVYAAKSMRFDIAESGGTSIVASAEIATSTVPASYKWIYGSGDANPVTGHTIGTIKASTSDAAGTTLYWALAAIDGA